MLFLLQCYVCFNAKITLNNTIAAPDSDMDTLEMETFCYSNQSHRVTFSIEGYLFICAFFILRGNVQTVSSAMDYVKRRGVGFFFCYTPAKMLPKYTWKPLASRKKLSRVGHAGLTLHLTRLSLEQNKWNKTCGSYTYPEDRLATVCKVCVK